MPILGLKTTKDFIKLNAVDNIMSVAKKPAKNFVDTKKGDKQPLDTSGLEPKYVHKKVRIDKKSRHICSENHVDLVYWPVA